MKIKPLIAGIIIGATLTTTVTAFGLAYASGSVEAWIQDNQVRIIVDGEYQTLPPDTHVLNYNNRVYTPARLVAESLGATVTWEEARQAIIIESAEPEVVEVEKEKEKAQDDETTKATATQYHYSPLPVRRVLKGVEINISSIEFYSSTMNVFFDLDNDSFYPILFLEEDTYIEADGKKYEVQYISDQLFNDTIDYEEQLKNASITFDVVPKDVNDIVLHMPVRIYSSKYADGKYETLDLEFYIDATEDRKN